MLAEPHGIEVEAHVGLWGQYVHPYPTLHVIAIEFPCTNRHDQNVLPTFDDAIPVATHCLSCPQTIKTSLVLNTLKHRFGRKTLSHYAMSPV